MSAPDRGKRFLKLSGLIAAGSILTCGVHEGRAQGVPQSAVPRAVTVARTVQIPACTVFVDAASPGGAGTADRPHKTIGAAVAAAGNGAIICVAEGTYAEQIKPGEKYFTLAGGFQRGSGFRVRDSAAYVSKAQGQSSGSFLRIDDPAPKGDQLTAVDGFEITGYSQGIVREFYELQKFDITNNHVHGNKCTDNQLAGGGFALNNVAGRIAGNVFRNNSCGRGGAGALNESVKANDVTFERNLVDANHGTEPDGSHGGGIYLFGKSLRITGNLFTRNTVTKWGGGLYVGSTSEPGQLTNARLSWNVYRGNRAGISGGGFFCDDGANCTAEHEIYARNCGGNILLDSGTVGPTVARFDHITNVGALDVECKAPGAGVQIDRAPGHPDNYAFSNSIFWGNAQGLDFVTGCDSACSSARVSVTHSLVQTEYGKNGLTVTFGAGNIAPADPLFVDAGQGDFHLQSSVGYWTPSGYRGGTAMSPAIGKGDPRGAADKNPERAAGRNELGAYGNSSEASYAR